MPNNIGTDAFQVVLFTSAFDLSNKLEVAQKLQKLSSIELDNVAVLPIPDDAPLEFPRIILTSKDKRFAINVSPLRVDITFQEKDGTDYGLVGSAAKNLEEQLIKGAVEVYNIISSSFSANVTRLALVVNQILKLDESSKKFLARTVIKKIEENVDEIKYYILFKGELGEYKINKWRRLDTLKNKTDLTDDKALGIVFDINTLPSVNYKFTHATIAKFLEDANALVKDDTKKFVSFKE